MPYLKNLVCSIAKFLKKNITLKNANFIKYYVVTFYMMKNARDLQGLVCSIYVINTKCSLSACLLSLKWHNRLSHISS